MALPYTPILTDVFGTEWALNQPGCPVRVRSLGIGPSAFKFDEVTGVNQAGVTVVARNDDPNVIPAVLYVDGPKGAAGVEVLSSWVRAQGRGMVDSLAGRLLRLTIQETDRYADLRLLEFASDIEWQKMSDTGRAVVELTWRNDNSYWFKDPIVTPFTAAQFSGATVANYGDVDTWPHVRIYGPLTSPTLGLAGETPVPLPTIGIGDYLDIEMDPDLWAVKNSAGVDKSFQLGKRWYRKAPAGNGAIPVVLTGTNTNSNTRAEFTIPQRFWSPL